MKTLFREPAWGYFFHGNAYRKPTEILKNPVKVNFHGSQLGIDVGKHRPSKKRLGLIKEFKKLSKAIYLP